MAEEKKLVKEGVERTSPWAEDSNVIYERINI